MEKSNYEKPLKVKKRRTGEASAHSASGGYTALHIDRIYRLIASMACMQFHVI